ncbi:MAG: cell division protein ZapA [Alphaproteobacteria bacterium]|nr:cell division protein ZapA [Alphaproteobacteria bacterium]
MIEISLMGRSYQLACPPDQHERVRQLAGMVEEKMRLAISTSQGTVGEVRLFLLAGLMLADEVLEAKAAQDKFIAQERSNLSDEENMLVTAVEHLSQRINSITSRIDAH